MRNLARDLNAREGLARVADLRALGHSRTALRRAVASGLLTTPRRGWVASSSAPPQGLRAVELGGKVGGASALQMLGIWVDDPGGLVVWTPPTASRLPPLNPGESRSYVAEAFRETSVRPWRASVRDAILQHSRVSDRAEMVAVLDSALHRGLLRASQLDEVLATIPRRARPTRSDLDAASMSGTESYMRFALRGRGYAVVTQASISRVGDVDLLVDGWFIVECDSRQFHGSVKDQNNDRRRDGNAALQRFSTARFTWEQVSFDLDWCLAVVEASLSRGHPSVPLNRTSHR